MDPSAIKPIQAQRRRSAEPTRRIRADSASEESRSAEQARKAAAKAAEPTPREPVKSIVRTPDLKFQFGPSAADLAVVVRESETQRTLRILPIRGMMRLGDGRPPSTGMLVDKVA